MENRKPKVRNILPRRFYKNQGIKGTTGERYYFPGRNCTDYINAEKQILLYLGTYTYNYQYKGVYCHCYDRNKQSLGRATNQYIYYSLQEHGKPSYYLTRFTVLEGTKYVIVGTDNQVLSVDYSYLTFTEQTEYSFIPYTG